MKNFNQNIPIVPFTIVHKKKKIIKYLINVAFSQPDLVVILVLTFKLVRLTSFKLVLPYSRTRS